jgi:hypothetical protein
MDKNKSQCLRRLNAVLYAAKELALPKDYILPQSKKKETERVYSNEQDKTSQNRDVKRTKLCCIP